MILHGYWRSSAAYRVRIGLALKGLDYVDAPHDLRRGEQDDAGYKALNPQGLVPALEVAGRVVTQSLAILEWLEEAYPEPALLPEDPIDRARARAMSALIACDIHPLNNLRVLTALRQNAGWDAEDVNRWAQTWIATGLDALESLVNPSFDAWCLGERPGLADCLLAPQ
ncbi:MAG: maleylacetoacetate isomerase, partial [Caulobacteraceae bacterium]